MDNYPEIHSTNLRNEENQQAGHGRPYDHENSQTVSSIGEIVSSKHKAERSTDTNQNHNNVHGDTDKARVVDVVVFDIAALVGKEETKDNLKPLVHIEGSNEVRKVGTITLLMDS